MTKLRAMDVLTNLLRSCSGANREILDREECRIDRDKYAGIGVSILLTGLLGSCSGGYALFVIFQSWLPATLFGLLWGSTIFNIDRSIVQSIQKGDEAGNLWLKASPRIFLAAFIALTVSKPLELRMFEPEINAQIQEHNLKAMSAAQLEAEKAFPRVTVLEEELRQLEAVVAKQRVIRDQAEQTYIAEAEGTGGTKKEGKGPVYTEKRAIADRVGEEFAKIEFSSQKVIETKQEELALLRSQKNERLRVLSQKYEDANGLLARMGALHELEGTNPAVSSASWAITALFLMIELAPIMSKLMAAKGPYDAVLQQEQDTLLMKIAIQTDFLEESIQQDVMDQQKARQSQRDLCNSQFFDAVKIAESSSSMAATKDELVQKIIDKAAHDLMKRAYDTRISQSQIKTAVDEVTNEELKKYARLGIKKKFMKLMTELARKEATNELNRFTQQGASNV
jgi:hypothetical protein